MMATLNIPKRQGPKPIKYELPMVAAEVPERYRHWLKKAQQGSLRAALNLKCLECSAWQRVEVAHCEAVGCSLWHLRPYRRPERKEETSGITN